jgi:hypothetical protein
MVYVGEALMSRFELESASGESTLLLSGLFGAQYSKRLQARRLVLTLPPGHGRLSGKRAQPEGLIHVRYNASASAKGGGAAVGTGFASIGACFGVTLGCLLAFLDERRDAAGARRPCSANVASLLRRLRTEWLPIATALTTMRGADVEHLRAGLASCRVALPQRATMPDAGVDVDRAIGNKWTVVGALASILGAYGCLLKGNPPRVRHLVADVSLIKAIRCAEEALNFWRPERVAMPQEHWAAVETERRAMRRAAVGAMRATEYAQERGMNAPDVLRLQLDWAQRAAYPANERVDEYTQTALILKIARGAAYLAPNADGAVAPSAPMVTADQSVPLCEIPESRLIRPRAGMTPGASGASGSDCNSDSEWTLVGSGGSTSARSHASRESADSLTSLGDEVAQLL